MQIKGTAVRSILLALERVCSADDVERVKAALSPEIRAQIEPVVLASKLYPIAVSASIQDAIRTELGGGSCAFNHRLGTEAARIDFKGVYLVFLRIADYETMLRRLDRAWRQYNSRGEVLWPELGPSSGRCVVQGVDEYIEPMWHSIAGRVEGLLLLSGAKHASVTVTSWSDQGSEFRVRWVR
jgi:hypothetical protein